MAQRDPRPFAFFLIAGGIGLSLWYGLEWWQMPRRTPEQVQEQVEIRLALELQHMGPQLQPTGERLQQLVGMIRAEVEAGEKRQLQEIERWIGLGLVMTVFGASSFVLSLARRR